MELIDLITERGFMCPWWQAVMLIAIYFVSIPCLYEICEEIKKSRRKR